MILNMQIQTFERMALKDGATLFKATLIDKSKPSDARCSTPFTMFLSEAARKRLPQGDPVDALVEVLVRRFANSNGDVQIKGEIVVPDAPEKSAASSPAKPASKPASSQAK